MIVKNKRLEKLCCFYVSEFHLEMILVPYINNVIEKNKKISILTEINLEETIKILMSKINLSEKRKKEILDLGWKNNQTPNIEEEMCVIVIGNKKYIEEANKSLKINDGIVIDCYYFDDIKDNITEIAQGYEKNLNTKGIQDI